MAGKQGFASMSPEKRSRIARLGYAAASENGAIHRWDSKTAKAASAKGVEARRRLKSVRVEIARGLDGEGGVE